MKRLLLPGLLLYTLLSGLGLFLGPGFSGPALIPYLAGYLFLTFTTSYLSLFTPERVKPYFFLWLGIIGLNFLVQVTGGPLSPLRPAYFLLAAAATFQPLPAAYLCAGTVLAVDAANLLAARTGAAASWPAFAGFAFSLIGVVALTAPVTARLRNQARTAQERYRKLMADARAVDPLAGDTGIEALSEKGRQAANISSAVEREGAFKGLIDLIYGFVPAHTYALFVAEREGQDSVFTLRAIRSESGFITPVGAVRVTRASGLIGICIDKAQPQYLPDMVIPAKSLGYYTLDVSVKSFLAIPIIQGETIMGVLIVDSREKDAFSLDTQDMLMRFAPFFSQIIEKIRISQELDLRVNNLAALHGMSDVLNSSLELTEVLDKLTDRIKKVVPYDICAFALTEEGAEDAVIAAQSGYEPGVTGKRFPLPESAILNQMAAQWNTRAAAQPYDFPDLGKRGRDMELFPLREMRKPLQSLYCLPLVAREKFIGACVIGSREPNAFAAYQKEFLGTLMNQVSIVIDNTTLHRRIRDMANTDGLTGLLNHRTFMVKMDEEFGRLDRDRNLSFSLLLLDIDHFKKINDSYGHPVGDVALKKVAGVIREMARSVDFVARYGGEEFAVGMVGADSKGAKQMAERIRKTVENTLITAGKVTLHPRVSIGVASYFPGCERKEELIRRADKALYCAKRSGRNQVCLYEEMREHDTPSPPVAGRAY